MKKKLLSLALCLAWTILALVACGPGPDRVRIEGKLDNITNADFFVYSEDGAFDGVDTIHIEDGEFVYERKVDRPILLTLLYPNYTQSYVIAEPGKTVKMRGDASKIGEAEITGTEQNGLLTDFRLKHVADRESDRRMAAAQFVRDHSATLAAVAVFRMYFADKETPDPAAALQLLDVLKKAQPKERAVSYLDSFFRPVFENGVGQTIPDFSAETLDGRTVRASDYRGKRLIVACLGSWQSSCRNFMRQLRKHLAASPARWECLIVSMDVDREVLRNQLKNDSIPFPVICDRMAFESPLVRKLGLHYVPSLMLVDEQGKIIQRDVQEINDARLD